MPNVQRRKVWYAERSLFSAGSFVWFYPCKPRPYGKDLKKRLGSICYPTFEKAFGCKLKRGQVVRVVLCSGVPLK